MHSRTLKRKGVAKHSTEKLYRGRGKAKLRQTGKGVDKLRNATTLYGEQSYGTAVMSWAVA